MRSEIVDFIRREFIGPDPIAPHIQENGEEILFNEPPRVRYSAGVLFPRNTSQETTNKNLAEEVAEAKIEKDEELVTGEHNIGDSSVSQFSVLEQEEEEIGLANSFLPCAMGLSAFVKLPKDGFVINVKAGYYESRDYTYLKDDDQFATKKAYFRIPVDCELLVSNNQLPNVSGTSIDIPIFNINSEILPLKLNIRNRTPDLNRSEGLCLFTFTLINLNTVDSENIKHQDCFFQVTFSVSSNESCFVSQPTSSSLADKDDERSNRLLFRNKKAYAVGHGCSPIWNDNDTDSTSKIIAEPLPTYEIKPIVPNELKSVALKMYDLSDLTNTDITKNLDELNSEYEKWILEQEKIANSELSGELLDTAKKHIESCFNCLARMKQGVQLLNNDKNVNRAFRLMNRSMLMQQLSYSIKTRDWIVERGNIVGLTSATIPNLKDQSTWRPGLGSWRPFQLAFVLMNLNSMFDNKHQDREIVDLIWFPTGGGKTEAYLGLSAFTIFLKRLKNPYDSGTTVLMRYTLRLLTAQQFQRAASLICACDLIRKENETELGVDRITIGLWVGDDVTPSKRESARTIFSRMEDGREEENPFIVIKCPSCGAQMGIIKNVNNNRVKGYKRRPTIGGQTIVYQCDNSDCEFSTPTYNLPLVVIDEDIYSVPPTLLIGTVDKFAMLTWRPDARSIFGFREEERITPPELIIQDELHLISGPLGSMVGLFETMIEELCSINNIKPKIVASSATISRAKEQINSLYGRGIANVNIFPSQCLNAGDSFFAYEDKSQAGRLYVGIFASALPSHATAQVRFMSSLLQSVKSIKVSDEKDRDPYWTVLNYFNSIRELGHAATLIRADIREYMNSIWHRKQIRGDERRFVNRDIELTSRISSSEITDYLEQLSKSWTGEKTDYPVDVCLATNMISVGVDIPRLGLMTVIGQPKTTSEYIQATSRVGRSKIGPGLVFTIYNCSKPRDRSHYEHFQEYHSKIYSKVEPTSVTPFSTPARERALHSILIGLIRYYSVENRERPRPFPKNEVIERVKSIIIDRVSLIDHEEVEKTLALLNEKLNYWKNELPLSYGGFGQIVDIPLMFPAGTFPSEDIKERAWATPTSMRSVDSTCEGYVITNYENIDN